MEHNHLEISSSEPLFFRDGRMGSNLGLGLFPPLPSVFLGAIRSHYFALNIGKFEELQHEKKDATQNFKISWFCLKTKIRDEQYNVYPLPADLKIDTNGTYRLCRLKKSEFASSMQRDYYVEHTSVEKDDSLNNYFPEQNFHEYINATRELQFGSVDLKDLIQFQEVTNNATDAVTGIVQDGNLFGSERVFLSKRNNPNDFSALNSLSFSVKYQIENWNIFPKGLIALGSEATMVSFVKSDDVVSVPACPIIETDEIFKMVLITPGFFQNGQLPNVFEHQTITVLAQCSGSKPVSIGGWDIAKNAPKPMMKAVSEGTVFFLKVSDKDQLEKLLNFHQTSISEFREHEGFGLVVFAKCHPNQINDLNK